MKIDQIMIRFGELSTKGKNKNDFIRVLAKNIKNALKEYSSLKYDVRHDHIYIDVNDENIDEIIRRLQDVSGIYSMSLVYKISRDLDIIKNTSLQIIKEEKGLTFKVKAKRIDKTYPYMSDILNREIAGEVLRNTSFKVDVHNPDIILNLEIHRDCAYLFVKTVLGAGGYPLGVGGKAMMMISGGIDSPVASYLLMKRGITLEFIHFASPPYTHTAVIYKIKDLLAKLNVYQPRIRLHIVPFTSIQEAINEHSNESYTITIMRRMMYRIAEKLANKRKCLALANGESIGQVASQTLNSIKVINEVSSIPVIRPLAVFDKNDIIKIAKRIDTFDISIRPYEDCCTIFTPKNPKTMPHLDDVKMFESRVDYDSLINDAIDNIEVAFIGEAN